MTKFNSEPCSFESEQSVIGSMLRDSSLIDKCKLSDDDFFGHQHRVIFRAIRALHQGAMGVDVVTVNQSIEALGVCDVGIAYLAELVKVTPSVANFKHYEKVVDELSRRRKSIKAINQCLEIMCIDSPESHRERISRVSDTLAALEGQNSAGSLSGAVAFRDIASRWADEIDERIKRKPGEVVGYETGFTDLDARLFPKGVLPGSLVVVGARPKMGKTSFKIEWAKNAALKSKNNVVIFSLEMDEISVFEKLVSARSGVSTDKFYNPQFHAGDMDLAYAAVGELAKQDNVFIDDTPGVSIGHVIRECRKIKREHGDIGLIAVDYLTLMQAEKAERNDLAYGSITKKLKVLAKELKCVVLLLTQLNRKLEDRSNKRPTPSDCRDTGQIEQDADLMIMLYRDAAYYPDKLAGKEFGSLAEVIVTLNRNGFTGTVYTEFKDGNFKQIDQGIGKHYAELIESEVNPQEIKRKRYSHKEI